MKGFTLVETIVTVLILVLSLGSITGLILNLYNAHAFTFQQAIAISEAKQGVEIMVREIREACQGEDGSYPIEIANDYEFVFYSDIDKDGAVERVRYYIDGNDFKKGVINPSSGTYSKDPEDEDIFILSKYIRNLPPIFHYYNSDLEELPAPARLIDTKMMKLFIVVNVDPNIPPTDFVMENYVGLRNLK